MLGRKLAWLIEALLPTRCIRCGVEGTAWCQSCQTIDPVPAVGALCPVCHDRKFGVCVPCRTSSALDSLVALYRYEHDNTIGQLIRDFKYQHAESLVKLWQATVVLGDTKYGSAVVIPVPLFSRRERERGYNQSALIGQVLANNCGFSINKTGLVRIVDTSPQADLDRPKRLTNVANAFAWQSAERAPHEVLLVDDIFTTGATMQTCARVLKEAGSKIVHGFTIASGA